MKHTMFIHSLAGIGCIVFGGLYLFSDETLVTATALPPAPVYQYTIASSTSPLPDIEGYIVMDEDTGEVLLRHEEQTLLPIASVAKLVVAGAILASPDDTWLAATTTITPEDIAYPESFGKLMVGHMYTGRELLFPYLLESSNDAGSALARTWGSSIETATTNLLTAAQVTEQMILTDINGLSADTVATPYALATVMRHLSETTPAVFDITRLPRYLGHAPLVNNSPLINTATYQGGKHGYTPAAERTIAYRTTRSFPDGERTIIVVILGTDDLERAVEAIERQIDATVTRIPQ